MSLFTISSSNTTKRLTAVSYYNSDADEDFDAKVGNEEELIEI